MMLTAGIERERERLVHPRADDIACPPKTPISFLVSAQQYAHDMYSGGYKSREAAIYLCKLQVKCPWLGHGLCLK